MRQLIRNIEAFPGAPVVTFVDGEGQDSASADFGSCGAAARVIAAHLRTETGLEPGDRALMLYTPSLEFVHALAGCLLAGLVPVPVCPPDPFNMRREMARLRAITRDCRPAVALCNAEYAQVRDLGDLGSGDRDPAATAWPDLRWLQTDDIAGEADADYTPTAIRDDDLAVLQYTSGSTGDPKGVAITHANVEHQCELNRRRLGLTPESRAVFWVPHYHDFGLISGIMNAFAGHGHIRLLSPMAFVARPSVWFDVLSRVAGTHTAAPNFGYELIIARSTEEERAGWDLSSLRVAMSAAEPINPDTVRRLREMFAPCGLRPDAFCPSYGLAEHTVGVTMAGVGEVAFDETRLEEEGVAVPTTAAGRSRGTPRTIVGCGEPVDVDVRIVDPETCEELGADRVGEIWVDSPSKAAGYWRRPEETEAAFRAALRGSDGSVRYLRTGDMGFLHGGELYVTGRRSEMLIVRGRNLFPQDIEASASDSHELIRPGGVVAFALQTRSDVSTDAVEGVGLVVELRKSALDALTPALLGEIGRAVERAVTQVHGVVPARVVLCRPGGVVKTSSGKRKRAGTRDALLVGELGDAGLILADRDGDFETGCGSPTPGDTQVDPEYQRLIADTVRQFTAMAGGRPARLFHPRATTLCGRLRVLQLDTPGLDAAAVFAAGAEFPVIVRHANGVTDDDAAWDNRGATVRILPAGRPDDLDSPVLDLLMTTGACFTSATAADFVTWMTAGRVQREDLVRCSPHLGRAAWEMFRLPDGYHEVHYHSKVVSRYVTADGREFLVRYRLLDPDHPEDGGRLEPDGPLPPDHAARLAGETRPATFLHDRLRRDIVDGGRRYLLQVQLRPAGEDGRDGDALDATRPWDLPWLDRAELVLTDIVDEARVEPLAFNPANAPESLGLLPATRATEPASLNHLRAIVYAAVAERRTGAPIPASLRRFLPEAAAGPTPPRGLVAVIGAGVSGLTVARELERRGHDVVVLERSEEVGGKARSIEVDGLAFDLGAHLCSRGYHRLEALLQELGRGTEDVSDVILWSIADGCARPMSDPALREEFLRYQQLKHERFPGVATPGLAGGGALLDQPAHAFFAEHDLQALGGITALGFTASGYGFLSDDDLSAHRMLKYAEVATLVMPGDQLSFWTPKGGFGEVWRQVAGALADVRTGCHVRSIRADGARVLIESTAGALEADAVVLACQPAELDGALEHADAPTDVLQRVQHIPYATFVVRAGGLPREGFYLVDDHLHDVATAGHVVAFHHRYPQSDVYLLWAYIDAEADDDALLGPLREDIRRMGGTLDEVLAIHRWDYAPHLAPPAADAYSALEEAQGRDGVYRVGSLLDFELVETNIRYALHVADLVDRRLTGDRPAGPKAGTETALQAALAGATEGERQAMFVDYLVGQLSRVLRRPADAFAPEHHLLDLGLDSIRAVEIFEAIGRDAGIELAPLTMYEHPTIGALAVHLARLAAERGAAPSGGGALPAVALDPARALVDQLLEAEGEAVRSALILDLITSLTAERLSVTRDTIDPRANIGECGLDSVKSVEVLEAVLAQTGLSLAPSVLAEHPTFAGLAGRLAVEFARVHPGRRTGPRAPAGAELAFIAERVDRMEGLLEDVRAQLGLLVSGAGADSEGAARTAVERDDPSPWLRRHRRAGRSVDLRLICFHSAGLDATMYDPWAERMPDGVELCAVRLPGRAPHTEPLAETIDELLPALHAALAPVVDRPFAVFGHSFGALTAYALTRYLRDRSERLPVRLLVAAFWAPDRFVCRPELAAMMEGKVAPGLTADQQLMDSWVHAPAEAPLPLPISVFHGAQDRLVPREDIEAWAAQSVTSTDIHVVPGGHFQLVTDPLIGRVVGSLMSLDVAAVRAAAPTRGPALGAAAPAPSHAALDDAESAWMTRHDQRFAEPADTRGSWNLWDLIHVARVRSDDRERPAYPAALEVLRSLLEEDGTFGDWRSPFPYNNFVLATAMLSTLLQWHGRDGRDDTTRFRPLERRILVEDELRRRDDVRGIDLPYGRYFKFPGMFGEALVPAFEADRLLRLGAEGVSDDARAVLQRLATEDALGSVERYFRFGDVALPFPEVYPAEAIRSDRVRAFAERAFPALPGGSTAFTARYFDVTRSPEAKAVLERALEGGLVGGLRPAGKLQEVLFSLLYLSKAGVDLTTHCPEAMAYLREVQRPYGVGIDERALDVDVDSTAIAMIVCAQQGVGCIVENGAAVLERMWDERRGSYRSSLGFLFNTNMLLLGARATLSDPAATMPQQRTTWERTLEHLDTRQWLSVDHISPLYLWEAAISFLFEFEGRFPERRTRHHHELVDLVLDLQTAEGGIHSYLFDEPDTEETALGLLALKAARAGDLAPDRDERVQDAIDRAHAWLAPRFAESAAREEHHYPEEWIGPLMFSDRKIVESVIAASLLKAPRRPWVGGAAHADLAAAS